MYLPLSVYVYVSAMSLGLPLSLVCVFASVVCRRRRTTRAGAGPTFAIKLCINIVCVCLLCVNDERHMQSVRLINKVDVCLLVSRVFVLGSSDCRNAL